MTTDPKLLPCPFCGGNPYTSTYYLGCDGCDIHFDIFGSSFGKAAARWNTRHPSVDTGKMLVAREDVERVRKALGESAILFKGLIIGTDWEIAPQIKSHMIKVEQKVCEALSLPLFAKEGVKSND
jgi:hypothetical protein